MSWRPCWSSGNNLSEAGTVPVCVSDSRVTTAKLVFTPKDLVQDWLKLCSTSSGLSTGLTLFCRKL